MATPLKNIIIAGASGSVGAPILHALLAEPSFTITILTRISSPTQFPPQIPVIKVSDGYTTAELTAAFTGQDAVVVALSTTPITSGGTDGLAYRLIDAALAAGVRRFIPSEFGANNLDPRARNLVPIYDRKGAMLEYLIAQAAESQGALTWSSISCGSWLDWALNPAQSGNFLGIDVKARKAVVWDSGRARFAVTTAANTGRAVAKALLDPAASMNRQIFLADFTTSTREVVESLESVTGEKFEVQERGSANAIREAREKYDAGDAGAAFALLAMSFGADVDAGYDFEKEQEVWNGRLGLPAVTLEEVVREAVELAKRT